MNDETSPCAVLDAQASARQFLDTERNNAPPFAFQGHGFVIDNLGFLLPAPLRCELVEEVHLCPLPGTQSWLLGMTHLRGKILPVFDLRRMVFSNAKPVRHQRFLFIDPADQGFAIAIGSMPFRLDIEPHCKLSRFTGVPELLLPFSRAVYQREKFWIELDYKAFFRQQSLRLTSAA